MNERISVIVPVYNAGKFINVTIESVLSQTYDNLELLLVDDGSQDNTIEIIERYSDSRIRLLKQANQGAATARNYGMDEASGRYIAFLDADDIWRPDKLLHELEFMKKTGASFVFTGYEFADSEGRGNGTIVRVPKQLKYRQALKNTTIFTSTVMLDRQKLAKELLRMPIIKSEDTAMWWQILRDGHTAYGLDENLTLYRRTQGSLSADKMEAVRRIWGLYRKSEKLGIVDSCWNFCFWAVRAVMRRI